MNTNLNHRILRRLITVILFFMLVLPAFSAEYTVLHKVTGVTVFPSRASITRRAAIQLPEGEHRLVFDQLPMQMLDNTLFSTATADGQLTIVSADIKTVHLKPTNSTRSRQLKEKIKQVGLEIEKTITDSNLIEKEISFLNNIQVATIQDINKNIKTRDITPDKWSQLYSFVFSKLGIKQEELRKIKLKLSDLYRQKNDLENAYDAATGTKDSYYKQVIVSVKAAGTVNCKIDILYQQKNAQWGPGYDFRLKSNGTKNTMQLTYFGTVTQQTGEDWNNISLQLSTAETSRWSAIPNTYPWYLDIVTVTINRNRYLYNNAAGASQSKQDYRKTASEDKIPAKNYLQTQQRAGYQQTRLQRGSTAVSFEVPGTITLKSDGTASRKVLQTAELPVTFTYKAIPQMSQDVFIEAKVKNSSKLFLLPGRAQLFRGNAYLGTTRIQATPPNGELSLFYGTDPSLSTKKELLEKKMDPGSDNELKYIYKLTVKNNKTEPVTVELTDMLPVSRNNDIEVSIKDLSMQPVKKEKNGKYSWKLTLKPGEEQNITYKLEIEYPSKKRISGLR